MPPHDIAKLWHSTIKFGTAVQPDDDFDLQALNQFGTNVTDCKHGNQFIHSGSVDKIMDAPNPGEFCYLVSLNHRPDPLGITQVQYRGVAMRGNDGQFHKIVGIIKIVFLSLPHKPNPTMKEVEDTKKELTAFLIGQDEGTWTGTQP